MDYLEILLEFLYNSRDLIVILLLMLVGFFHKRIKGPGKRKWLSTMIGCATLIFFSKSHWWIYFLIAFTSFAIVKESSKRYFHIINFTFIILCMIFFFIIVKSNEPRSLQLFLGLKLMGVAFEMHKSIKRQQKDHSVTKEKLNGHESVVHQNGMQRNHIQNGSHVKAKTHLTVKLNNEQIYAAAVTPDVSDPNFVEILKPIYEEESKRSWMELSKHALNPSYMELFHYTFSYLGMHLGPYISYRTHKDFIELPFSRNAPNWDFFKRNFVKAFVYASLWSITNEAWAYWEILASDDYHLRSFWYKMYFSFAVMQVFRFFVFGASSMAVCVCTAAGIGAYPTRCKSKGGHGPTESYDQLKNVSEKEATLIEYDFTTIVNMDIDKIQETEWLNVYHNSWNKTVHYWIAEYFVKDVLPYFNRFKTLSIIISWMTFGLLQGTHLGYFLCSTIYVVYTKYENRYFKMFQQNDFDMSLLFFWLRFVMFNIVHSHAIAVFVLSDFKYIFTYVTSVYFAPYIVLAIFCVTTEPILKMLAKNLDLKMT